MVLWVNKFSQTLEGQRVVYYAEEKEEEDGTSIRRTTEGSTVPIQTRYEHVKHLYTQFYFEKRYI